MKDITECFLGLFPCIGCVACKTCDVESDAAPCEQS